MIPETVDPVLAALRRSRGIVAAVLVPPPDRATLLAVELEAEKRSLLGLGKVVNEGVRLVLTCPRVYAALTNMDFDWGCRSALVLKKGEELVGEEVRDETRLAGLRGRPEVWFLHESFVVYKDRVQFPRDLLSRACHFAIPALPADWLAWEGEPEDALLQAMPSVAGDSHLKAAYFGGADEKGLGTILLGAGDADEPA